MGTHTILDIWHNKLLLELYNATGDTVSVVVCFGSIAVANPGDETGLHFKSLLYCGNYNMSSTCFRCGVGLLDMVKQYGAIVSDGGLNVG